MVSNAHYAPTPITVPEEEIKPYVAPMLSNPVLSGRALGIAATLIENAPPLQALLYRNAGFPSLRKLVTHGSIFADATPRWDPTVVPSLITGGYNPDPALLDAEEDGKERTGNLTCRDYTNAYLTGKTTPLQVATNLLALIERNESHKLAFILIDKEGFLAAATESTARYTTHTPLSPLDGIPFVVKDELSTPHPLHLGTSTPQSHPPTTAHCVGTLLAAGACLVGKTNMHELGLDTTGLNVHHGTPPNPHSAAHYTGGSSSGSGYCVGAGLVPFAVAADGGGSIRIPASYCGVFGLKPSHNRVSEEPCQSIAPTVGVIGPIAGSMHDLGLVYTVMARSDPIHTVQRDFPPAVTHPGPGYNVRKKRLGVVRSWVGSAEGGVRGVFEEVVGWLEGWGYEVVEVELPYLKEAAMAHALTILSEISSVALAPGTVLSAPNRVLFGVAGMIQKDDLVAAQRVRSVMMGVLAGVFERYPGIVIVTPTTPGVVPRLEVGHTGKGGWGVSDSDRSVESMRFVGLANLCGLPAVAAVGGWVKDGEVEVPVGVMGCGEWGFEEEVLEFGRGVEAMGMVRRLGKGGLEGVL